MKFIKRLINKFKRKDDKIYEIYHLTRQTSSYLYKVCNPNIFSIQTIASIIFIETDVDSFTLISEVGKITLIFDYIPSNIESIMNKYKPLGILHEIKYSSVTIGEVV